MGDAQAVDNSANNGSTSETEKQYLEDLAKATRLSLECYEHEQQMRKNFYGGLNLEEDEGGSGGTSWSGFDVPDAGFGRRLSQPDGPTINEAKQPSRPALELKARPRPFARATSSSNEGSIISPPPPNFISPIAGTPGAVIQPPPTNLKRQHSLPHRTRHPNYPLQQPSSPASSTPTSANTCIAVTTVASCGLGFDPITNNSSSSILSFTNNNKNTPATQKYTTNSNSSVRSSGAINSNNTDLISLASPKVTPKFDKSNGGGGSAASANILSFCDNLYSTPVDDTSLCLYSSSASTSSLNNSVMSQRSSSHSPSPRTPFAGVPNNPVVSTNLTPSPFTPLISNNGHPYRFPYNPSVPMSTLQNSSAPSSTSSRFASPMAGNMLALNRSNLSLSPSPSPSYFSPMQTYLNNGPRPLTQGPSPQLSLTSMFPQLSKNTSSTSSSRFSPTNGHPSNSTNDQNTPGHRTSLYQGVNDQLKSISANEDLIDLGNVDGRNILEYFDPLVIREKWAEEEEHKKIKQEQLDKERKVQQQQEKAKQLKEEEYDNAGAASVQSYGSTATTAFSYRQGTAPSSVAPTLERQSSQSMSLYPSLDEFLGPSTNGRCDDPSNFYDAYNPFEYLYTVSCSSPSANSLYETLGASNQLTYENGARRSLGFSHFFSQHPTPVLPPALPPRNSIESSSPSRPSSPQPSTSTTTSNQNDAKIMLRLKSISHDKAKRSGKLYENIESIRHSTSTDNEIQAFYDMVQDLRFSRRHVDADTNKGYIKSPTIQSQCCSKGLSLRVIVWPEAIGGAASAAASEPVSFTCDVSSTVDMVVEQSILELDVGGSARDYILRVKGWNEYLDSDIPLADYQFIQQNIKLDQDIQLVLVARSALGKDSWARTARDDANSVNISIDDILPEIQCKTIDHSQLCIPLEIIEREADRLKETLSNQYFGNNNGKADLEPPHLNPSMFVQPVKAVCVLLGEVVTVEIVHCLDFFVKTCEDWNRKTKSGSPTGDRSSFDADSRRRTKVGSDVNSRLSYVEIVPVQRRNSAEETLKDAVLGAIERVREAVRALVEMYSKSFPVSFRMKEIRDKSRLEQSESLQMSDMLETFLVRIGAIHRLKPEWLSTYSNYVLTAEVYHGTRWMGKVTSSAVNVTRSDSHWFFNTIVFDGWLNFEHMPVCILPRESRIVFTLYGRKPHEESSSKDQNPIFSTVELGWASTQLFNFKGLMAQGNCLLPFWPVGLVQKRLGPAPNSSFSADSQAPLLTIEFSDFGYDLYFPEAPQALPISRDIQTLDSNSQVILKDIVHDNTFTRYPAEDREVLWEKRHYLYSYPTALPKVLLVAQLWDWASLGELHALLSHWSALDPLDAFQLLLPCFPDTKVREQGIRWISVMGDEELINLLPQLVEALSYETFDLSQLAKFLLSKSLSSLQISHHLFWLLASQVGLGKWAREFESDHIISKLPTMRTENTYDPKRRRLELMLNSLVIMSGEKWKHALFTQYKMIEGLAGIAAQVKAAKDSARTTVLTNELRKLSANIFDSEESYPLPVSPSAFVNSIDVKACSYFNSNALPLKITFGTGLQEGGSVSTIFKLGDDLRQDALTIQTIRVIEKWWLKDGLDLRILTFSCVPTGMRQGMVEMVNNAETLCKIQAEHGVTGVFRDSAIAEWLAKMNPSTLDYRRAIDNFTVSCAAYCVVTYILGICDRHNDNIMLTKKGHLFHIDFGKFLGDAQMFGNFKRDRTPFVLTSDMVYVINDGEKGSLRFHRFVELCCQGFRIIRRNGNSLLNLFALMATAGIPGVDLNSVSYIETALLPECSNVEAAARFTRFIEESSGNWFTPFNFFLHSLAQLRFGPSESNDDPTKLSFVPTIYTMEMDGRIERALVVTFEKKYDPEKYYLYTVKIKRKAQTDWSFVHRTYKEFLEFHSKMCINFPMAVNTLKTLPKGAGLGRSNVKHVAEKRKVHLQGFLESLFSLADEISHSDLVYTFFHPLLRDEAQHMGEEFERRSNARASLTKNPARIHGQLKLSLEYQRGALLVLVVHAVDLACPNNQPPSPYVKVYLQPDSGRVTKRKTRVVRRSQHPTFMETIVYRLPLEIICQKTLQVSVWHHDPLQENNFLGGVAIKLSEVALDRETETTYILGNITSSA